MSERNPKITIMIISYNRRILMERCIYCIFETTKEEDRDIIICDNGSTDDSPDFLGTLVDYPGVKVIRSDKNLGSEAIFKMMKFVKTPYWVAFDADCWMETRNWIDSVVAVFEARKELAALTLGQHLDERAIMGIDWDENVPDGKGKGGYETVHKSFEKLSKPRFHCENFEFYPPYLPVDGKVRPDIGEGNEFLQFVNGYWILETKLSGPSLPGIPMAGTNTVWRTELVKDCAFSPDSGIMTDIGNLFHIHMMKSVPDYCFGSLFGVRVYHAYGPWWYMGNQEKYWRDKSDQAPKIYNRPAEKQWSWMDQCKKWSGWGRPLEKVE